MIPRYLLLLFSIFLSIIAAQELPPPCGQNCIGISLEVTECNPNDIVCLCKDVSFLTSYYDCLVNGGECKETEQKESILFAHAVCASEDIIISEDPLVEYGIVDGGEDESDSGVGTSNVSSTTSTKEIVTFEPTTVTKYSTSLTTYITTFTTLGSCLKEALQIFDNEIHERDVPTTSTLYSTIIQTLTRTITTDSIPNDVFSTDTIPTKQISITESIPAESAPIESNPALTDIFSANDSTAAPSSSTVETTLSSTHFGDYQCIATHNVTRIMTITYSYEITTIRFPTNETTTLPWGTLLPNETLSTPTKTVSPTVTAAASYGHVIGKSGFALAALSALAILVM